MIFGLSVEELCDWIILIAAAGAALYKILGWFKSPFKWGKKKKEEIKEERKQEICGVLDEELPGRFLEHDLETRQKYLNDRLNYLNEIKNEILADIGETLSTVRVRWVYAVFLCVIRNFTYSAMRTVEDACPYNQSITLTYKPQFTKRKKSLP